MENKYTRFGYAFASVLMLATLAGCHQTGGEQEGIVLDSTPTSAVPCYTDSSAVISENYIIEEMRHPDVVLHIKRGQPLAMQTDGLILTAVDAAVQREADYSVTSLENEELPPMPQGMKNMTAAAAGYRLLPSGEHFMPYAELRVAYDPARLPQGYTPDDIYTSFYDTATLAWVRLERVEVDTVNHEIVSRTTHFTDFINELLKAPEMPETQAFVPTAMTDLEAVSPMDGLTLIQPPTANNNGTANISYPLVIPSGRGGMQPNLTLTYSSTGGSGWLGVGWDIPVPSITLDTRWGVPRYSTTYETEIYMLDGEQLITKDSNGVPRKMPHRTNHQLPRLPDSTQFFARTGDAHDSIMRYGTGPQDYWWVVTDRNGITHYYGRYVDDARNVFPTTLCDDNGNIARWALAESRDLYGNNVRYYYSIDTVTDYVNEGRQLYLDSITYTGHQDTDGVYTVVFQRKDNNTPDIPVVCNNGFKEMTAQQLCYVALKYHDTIMTAWLFNMENSYSSNYKNRLSSFTKVDTTIIPFPEVLADHCQSTSDTCVTKGFASVTTRFSYYDAPSAGSMFGSPHGSKLPDDTVSAFMVSGVVSLLGINKATALGISHSNSWNVGGALTVGVPSVELWNSNLSLGGNYHYNSSTSEGVMSLVDLDGDGLADKVFVKNGQMHFRRQLPPKGFTIRFSDTLYTIDSITSFLRESSSSNTWGVQASLAVGASASWTHSESETSTYFADVNGDGLVDIVEDDHVWFNRLENGYPTFARHEEITQVTGGDEPETPATDTLSSDCMGFIFDGEVNDSIDCRRIWVLIDFDEKPRDSSQIVNEISNYQGSNYKHVVVPSDTIGKWWLYIYRSEWDCDYHETTPNTEAVRVWIAPDSGTIEIVTKVSLLKDTLASRKDRRLADGVIYTIQHSTDILYGDTLSNPNGSNTILLSQEICDTCYNPIDNDKTHYIDTTIISLKIARGDMLFFRLRSKNNHRLDNVHDSIEIVYTSDNASGDTYSSHDDFVLSGQECFQSPVAGMLDIETNFNQNGADTFKLVVFVGDSSFEVTQNILKSLFIEQNTSVCFEVQQKNSNCYPNWGDVSCRPHLTFYPNNSLMVTDTVNGVNDTTYKNLNEMSLYLAAHMAINQTDSIYSLPICQQLFGPLYKGWGQFAYHSLDSGIHADTLRVEMLKAPDSVTLNTITQSTVNTNKFKNSSSLEEFQNNNSFFNPLSYSSYWVEMMPDAEHGVWISYGLQNTIGRDTMCNALHKEWYAATPELPDTVDYSLPQEPSVSANTEDAPVKTTLKTTNASSQCYSLSALHLGLTYSNGMNGIGKDYIDLNGDRYPDFVGPEKVQYSQLWGGIGPLQDLSISLEGKNQSVTNSVGVNFSATPTEMERVPSQNSSKSKFTLGSKGSSASGGGSIGWDNTSGTWMDFNGDGLPDFVTDNGYVKLNIGYRFLNQETSGIDTLRSGVSGTLSESLGGEIPYDAFSLWQGSIKAGFGLDASNNQTTSMLIDLNGDGLPDRVFLVFDSLKHVFESGLIATKVIFNQGNGAWSDTMDVNIDRLSSSTSFSENLDLGITVGIPQCCFNIEIGVNGSPYGGSVNRDHLQLVDINADGLPDLVTSDREDSITVRYNRGGRTNLLRTVTNFTGARFHLEYTLSAPSRQQPSRSWLLTTVTTKDPLNPNGGDTTVTHFDYADPHYDRFERTSYGYKYVTTTNIIPTNGNPYRKIKRTYYNNNMLRRGRLKEELTYVDSNTLYIKKVFDCEYRQWDSTDVEPDVDCPGYAFNMSERTTTTYYEGDTIPLLTTAELFEYDRYHNVVRYTDLGDTNDPADGLVVTFHYLDNLPNNLIALRSDYKITDIGSSTPLRETRFEYDTAHGKLIRQVLLNGTDSSVYEFEYDTAYGNLAKGTQPQNDANQRMTFDYTYDNMVHTYPIRIVNAFGETVNTTYNYRFGKPTSVTDPANNVIIYRYDFAGRLTSVTSPLNTSSIPSLINRYYPINYYHDEFYSDQISPTGHLYSTSSHYDDNGTLITQTAVLTDGFGRVLQAKKGLTVDGVEKMQVSGRFVTDSFGRTVEQYDPVLEDTSTHIGQYNSDYEPDSRTKTTYDVLDRVTKTVQPLGITTLTSYTIDGDESGHRYFITTTTDPNGYDTKQYSDYEGRQVQVDDANGGITMMHYDNLGQLVNSTDPEGFSTYYSYDMLGRMVQRKHPDAGVTTYTYDPAGNITQETTPLGQINYDYTYYRLMRKRYSNMTGNDVSYSYDNAGRPVYIEDGSGTYECGYDALGNVTEETRTLILPNEDNVYRFRMKYVYDSWGRMLNMVYPDSEAISYTYQWGGDLYAMHGNKRGDPRTYINKISYNLYGQKSKVEYGNSTQTLYSYDKLHRLVNLKSYDASGVLMQKIDYTFDNASNVTAIANTAGIVNTLGGGYENTYSYDPLHRLINSSGGGVIGNYDMTMDYSPAGRIRWKSRNCQSVTLSDAADMAYGYCDDYQPHAVKRMFDYNDGMLYDMRWDEAGNLGQVSIAKPGEMFEAGRFLFWTEDSRMHAAVDDKHYSYYAYDHSGERRLKLTGDNKLLDVNADFMATYTVLNEPTLYPSAYMVLTNKGYTKHYYAGTERVAARLGGGGLDALYHAIGNNNTIQTKANLLFDQSLEQVNNRILYENNLDCIMSNEFAKEEFGHWIDGIPYQMKADVEFDYKKFKKMVHSMLDDRNHGKEEEVYFYHSDHLGSASWITDSIGIPIQHLQYLPYGEPYVDQRHAGSTYSERFTFTGKEKDEETGYGYFGARYMDHELMTMWLSVDPMSDKYPSLSPYNYCAWNPIKLTDPNGNEPVKPLIKYYGKGTFMVNTDNLRNVTRKQIELANYNGAHDEGNVGVNLTIGHYSTPKTNPVTSVPLDAVGIDPDHIITQTPPTGNLKRNGQPYYNKYQWNSCAKGAGLGKSAGIAFLAVDVLVYAANMYQMIGINKDNNELRRQTNLLNRAADMVTKAVESGIIFNETQASSNDFLGDVINYIYQGTHVFNGGTVTDRIISPDAINKAKEIMKQNKLDYPLISY